MNGAMSALRVKSALSVLALLLATTGALAQRLPLPDVPPPPAPFQEKTDCSAKGIKALEEQVAQIEDLEKTAPETIGLFCSGIEMLSQFMEWKDDEPLPAAINDLAKQLLHQNLTPRMVKAMCRQAQGEAGRNFRTEIGQLKDRIQGCKGV